MINFFNKIRWPHHYLKSNLLRTLVCVLSFLWPSTAYADVTVAFYSHDFGNNFPHAFLVANGTLADGTQVDENFGFTAKTLSPRILLGSVKGIMKAVSPAYIKKSDMQFSITLDEQEYQRVKMLMVKWQSIPGKSYNVKKRNCVFFVRDVLIMLGYKINTDTTFMKKPKSFLRETKALNPSLQNAAPLKANKQG